MFGGGGGAAADLLSSGEIPAETVAAFVDRCVEWFRSDAALVALRQARAVGTSLEDEVCRKQEAMWEALGVQGKFGMQQMGTFLQRFMPTNQQLAMKFRALAMVEEDLLDQVEMSPEQLEMKRKTQAAAEEQMRVMASLTPEERQRRVVAQQQKVVELAKEFQMSRGRDPAEPLHQSDGPAFTAWMMARGGPPPL